MSSDQRSDLLRRLSPRTWTLRTRMITAVVALLWVLCVVIGATSVVALRGFLVDRLDGDLVSAMRVVAPPPNSDGRGPDGGPEGTGLPPGGGPRSLGLGTPSQCTSSTRDAGLPFPGLPGGSAGEAG
jgi:two-component system, OmpR family, sensor kinase